MKDLSINKIFQAELDQIEDRGLDIEVIDSTPIKNQLWIICICICIICIYIYPTDKTYLCFRIHVLL